MSASAARKWENEDDHSEVLVDEPVKVRISALPGRYRNENSSRPAAPFEVRPASFQKLYPPVNTPQSYSNSFLLPLQRPDEQAWFKVAGTDELEISETRSYAKRASRHIFSFALSGRSAPTRLIWLAGGILAGCLILGQLFSLAAKDRSADIYLFGATGNLASNLETKVTPPPPAPPALPGSVEGKPSISVSRIEQVLRQYNSPAVSSAQYMYDSGLKYGIDPAYALAFFIHESSAGTKGIAVTTKSIGNIRQTPNSGFEGYQGFRKYPSWEAGIDDWYRLISNLYIKGWGLRTVEQIIPKYAPAADNNNEAAYISHVNNLVEGWRKAK